MNRRQYLTRAGAGTLALPALAGCLDDLSRSESTTSAEDRTGERELSRAAGTLNEAALALDIEDGGVDDSEDVEFDPDEPTGLIDDARGHLETAAAELDDDRALDIETLETYADILEALVVVTETITDENLESDADAVFDGTVDDGDLEDATETVDRWMDELESAEARHGGAVSDYEALDGDRFEELARIDPADLGDGIESLGGVLGSLVTLVDGFDSMLVGHAALEDGQESVENDEYERAKAAFGDAESAFETARKTFDGAEDSPARLDDQFETARCQSGHLAAAAEAFGEAAAAAESGDLLTANQREREAERSLEAADDCTE
ncbi:hypothetical protein [Natronorubrum texcoconense]|uniref:Uncharacterized protein n=1 Tax=Natronorubrum texcoconense TaxID=1095776 RepID=A0A1G9BI61_9EURY|nr:hypothetical protein [Natronorubrum texcoconense]SDK39206.1 hypothetical protein SAMN04515672_2969 [Natronorubrum texcoconense]